MGDRTEQLRDKLATVRKATDEARASGLSAEDRLTEIEERETRRASRRAKERR